jgi:hypothetical protein
MRMTASDFASCHRLARRVVLRDMKRHQKCSPLGATDAVRDHSTGSGLQAWLSRWTEERAAMIWLKEMLLLSVLLVPPMVMQSIVETCPGLVFWEPVARSLNMFFNEED